MKAIQLSEFVQDPSGLTVSSVSSPTPSSDQYSIAIHAASTNFFDLLQIAGKYQHQPPFPFIAGAEFSGVITAIPTKSKQKPKYAVGDRVMGSAQGSYATQICAREEQLRPVPKGFSFLEGASLFSTMATSYCGLVTRAKIQAGDWVLIHAAAGGVGLAAVQIAKAFGATVIATAGTQHKLDVAKRFGADYGVNYTEEKEWWTKVQELTPKKRGVDIVYDPVGLIDKSMKCIAFSGRLVVVGFVSGTWENVATNRILLKNISVMGLHWGAYSKFDPEEITRVWDGLFKLFDAGKIRGAIFDEKEYVGLESVPEALKALGGRETWGKVVVKVPQEGAEEEEEAGEKKWAGTGMVGRSRL